MPANPRTPDLTAAAARLGLRPDVYEAKVRVARERLRKVMQLRDSGEVCWLSVVYKPDPAGLYVGSYEDDLRTCAYHDVAMNPLEISHAS